ncbi:uncharacterized protein PRCAT00005163001, partial [Priceomyces carsonii]|uniref:uncharacterized protein n=1 Tax=Priceomyces carsonii TaxID=28549 RepID=UPI002ED7C059
KTYKSGMSSKAGSKKASGDTASVDGSNKKPKLPKEIIVRPSFSDSLKSILKVQVNEQLLKALDIANKSTVYISKIDCSDKGVLGVISSDLEIQDKNVIQISTSLRELGGMLLGDRVEIKKYSAAPKYAKSILIHLSFKDNGIQIEGRLAKSIEKAFDDIGLISPGLNLRDLSLSLGDEKGKIKADILVVDVNEEESLEAKLERVSISDPSAPAPKPTIETTTPTYIFSRGQCSIIYKEEGENIYSKYPNLPHTLRFSQVGGLSNQISLLKSNIELPLHNTALFSDFGIPPPRGVLLHGPPGTGKTMLLRCVANEVNAHILTVNGPSIVSKYLGETENAIREIFQEAKRFEPSIVFLDEIDSLAPNRNSDDSGETESRVVATLLTVMDGMGHSGKVVVVGATNRPNSVDPALRRPGRFDREIEIGIPDVAARYDILLKHFEKMNDAKYDLTLDEIKSIAMKTHGYVGADLTALCRESVMVAINRGLESHIQLKDIKLTLDDIEVALPEIRPSAMREIFLEMPKVYWSDIVGQEDLKKKLVEVVQLPLEAADTFKKLGIRAPKGVLLYGPPGCSKTLTAKALATESGLNFLAVKGPEIFNKYVGESERTIREIFRKARAAAPSIIFFDEIDAISGDRENETSAAQNVLTSLLNEIDGVEELKGVVIVAATNKPTEIDPALLRPGRLDRHIYVGPPDCEARLQMLKKGCSNFNLSEGEVNLERIAELSDGCSGA